MRGPEEVAALGAACRANDLTMLISPLAFSGTTGGGALNPSPDRGFRVASPAPGALNPSWDRSLPILAWYLADEPDVTGMTEEALLRLDARVRLWGPGIPTTFVVGDGGDAPCFARAAQILMVDWYPIPHLPTASVGDHVRWTVDAAGGRPVWAVLQAYDWRDQPQRNPNKPRIGRFPTAPEMRAMALLAIANGATGLFFFQDRKPGGKTLRDFPDQWADLTAVVRDLSMLAPGLARGTPLPSRSGVLPGFTVRAWRDGVEEFVVLANGDRAGTRVVPPALRQDLWEPLFGGPRPTEPLAAGSAVVLHRTNRYPKR